MQAFMEHVADYGLSYGTIEEFNFRQNIWELLDAELKQINGEQSSFTVGHNFMSTWTAAEKQRLNGFVHSLIPEEYTRFEETDEKSVNWVEEGAVTPVKNQGQCGSCWSFSTTGALEGAHFIKSGKLVALSEQQFVDCDTKQDQGCNGGLMDNAFEFAKTNAIMTEADYPYLARRTILPWDKKCGDAKTKGVVTVSSYSDVTPKSSSQLKAAVAKGPVSVAIEADKTAFQGYTGGVITGSACGTQLDHGFLAVGYGTESGQDYFLVKNSWGPSWGVEGYVKIGQDGVCGITYQPSYPATN